MEKTLEDIKNILLLIFASLAILVFLGIYDHLSRVWPSPAHASNVVMDVNIDRIGDRPIGRISIPVKIK